MNKAALRKTYLEKRRSLSDRERMKLDDLLLIQFQQLAFDDIFLLFSYWPMMHTAEPDTSIYTRYLQHMIPGLQVAYPVTDIEALTMEAHIVSEETAYKENKYQISEPLNTDIADPQEIDVVFVPLIVCDQSGYRVGYGKGFYDRYLARCREDIICIGFSYFEAVDKIDDTHEYDVPLNYCITPQTIYEF